MNTPPNEPLGDSRRAGVRRTVMILVAIVIVLFALVIITTL